MHHGRWDRMCPPENALESYQQRLRGAQLTMVVDESLGHLGAKCFFLFGVVGLIVVWCDFHYFSFVLE